MARNPDKERIVEMFETFVEVARGNYSVQLDLSGKNDALDSLAMGFNMMIDDIRQRAEEIETQKEYTESIFLSMTDALFVVSPKGIIETVNKSACTILGYPEDELIGKQFASLFSARENWFKELLTESLAMDFLSDSVDRVLFARDGKRIHVILSCSVMHADNGNIRAIVCVAKDISERKRLEKEILEVSDREKQRIGHDLHDGVCQHLTGIALLVKLLQEKVESKSMPAADDAGVIIELVEHTIEQVYGLSKGLLPVSTMPEGLLMALRELAGNTSDMFTVSCKFRSTKDISVEDHMIATHFFRIAQESVHNAIKHGKAGDLLISLSEDDGLLTLLVESDGLDFPEPSGSPRGMGLNIMQYRAQEISAKLDVGPNPNGGTIVRCSIQMTHNKENTHDTEKAV